jgi:hypothetical protein
MELLFFTGLGLAFFALVMWLANDYMFNFNWYREIPQDAIPWLWIFLATIGATVLLVAGDGVRDEDRGFNLFMGLVFITVVGYQLKSELQKQVDKADEPVDQVPPNTSKATRVNPSRSTPPSPVSEYRPSQKSPEESQPPTQGTSGTIHYFFDFLWESRAEKPPDWDSMTERQQRIWVCNQVEKVIPADLWDVEPIYFIATDEETKKIIYEGGGLLWKTPADECCWAVDPPAED